MFEGTLYYCTPFDRVFALDPESGKEKWSFDPGVNLEGFYLVNCRGVSAWRDPSAPHEATCALRIFVERFFDQQFKRSMSPDGPKVGSVSLSPRGDWRMPSDADAAAWLRELEQGGGA